MFEWKLLNKSDAKKITDELLSLSPSELDVRMKSFDSNDLSESYIELRKRLVGAFDEIESRIASSDKEKTRYRIDLDFGIRLYTELKSFGFGVRQASMSEVWSYLACIVMPDIIYRRYKNVNPDSYWKKVQRNYFRMLWWYVYLSLQDDDLEKTKDILKDNTVDTIVQLIDRTGTFGFRVEVVREIMRQFARENSDKMNLFRRIMVVYGSIVNVEPALGEGGIEGFVRALFKIAKGEEG